jgi:hypothetical protein
VLLNFTACRGGDLLPKSDKRQNLQAAPLSQFRSAAPQISEARPKKTTKLGEAPQSEPWKAQPSLFVACISPCSGRPASPSANPPSHPFFFTLILQSCWSFSARLLRPLLPYCGSTTARSSRLAPSSTLTQVVGLATACRLHSAYLPIIIRD